MATARGNGRATAKPKAAAKTAAGKPKAAAKAAATGKAKAAAKPAARTAANGKVKAAAKPAATGKAKAAAKPAAVRKPKAAAKPAAKGKANGKARVSRAASKRTWGVEHMKGVTVVTPTPALPGAEKLDARDTVNVPESEKMIRALIDSGVDAIVTNGTLGEMATLSREEWETFARVVAETSQAANPDIPVFVGATTLSARETAERIGFLRDLGLRGAFLGRPFWSALGVETMIRYYEDLADAFPEMSFVLYDNPEAFKGPIPPPVYAALAKHPAFIGVKYALITPKFRSDVLAVGSGLRILPIEADWLVARTLFPEEMLGCWSSSACCGPEPALGLRDAFARDDLETARWLTQRIEWSYDVFLARQNFPEFSKYNIPLEKVRFDEAGFVKAGPTRAPYHVVPDEYMQGARENGRRWRQVAAELAERVPALTQ